jgi:outer membrane protein
MKSMIKPLALATAMIAASTSTQVMALEAGDWIFRSGLTTVDPKEDSDAPVHSALGDLGGEVSVDSDTQLGITVEYMYTKNIGIELLAATPFEHTVSAKGGTLSALGLDEIADVKHLPPTLSVNYHFDTGSNFTPYVGLGINYTIFFSEEASSGLEAAVGDDDVELDDSIGWAAQVGFDYELNDKWMINASARYIDIETEAEIKTPGLAAPGHKVNVDVDIDPMVYSLSVGYKF